jgi:hypothetical protein
VSGAAPISADLEQLLIVRVEDQINPTLAGRAGASYDSPPQPPEQALTLVGLLLGWSPEPLDGQTRWRCAIAGGTRTVTLDTVEMTGNVRGHGDRAARTASGESHVAGH